LEELNIAPDIPLGDVIWGVLPFVILMTLAVVRSGRNSLT